MAYMTELQCDGRDQDGVCDHEPKCQVWNWDHKSCGIYCQEHAEDLISRLDAHERAIAPKKRP